MAYVICAIPLQLFFPLQYPSGRAGRVPGLSWRDRRGIWNLCTIAAIRLYLYGTSAEVPGAAKAAEGNEGSGPKDHGGPGVR